MSILSSILDRVERIAIAAAIVLLLAMGLLMNVEVFGRYLFGHSTQIADEFAGYFFTAITLLCFVPASRHGRFLRVSGLIDHLPGSLRTLLNVVAAVVGAIMSAVLAYTTFVLAQTSWMFGTVSLQAVQVPLVIPQAVLPVGFGLLALAFVEQGALALLNRKTGDAGQEPEILSGLD